MEFPRFPDSGLCRGQGGSQASKKIFRANFVLQNCHPKKHGSGNSTFWLTFLHRPTMLAESNPKTLLRLFFCLARLFEFSGAIFRDPPRISLKTSIKIALRGYFVLFGVIFGLARLILKNSLKRFLGNLPCLARDPRDLLGP